MKNNTRGEGEVTTVILIAFAAIILLGGIAGCMRFMPEYKVYEQRKAGEAMLAHATASKEVAVAEARAKMESASLLAQAEVERAKGVAQANKIIGDSLKDNAEYLHYLYIQALADKQGEVIYVPTEAGLPILEAGRLGTKARKQPAIIETQGTP